MGFDAMPRALIAAALTLALAACNKEPAKAPEAEAADVAPQIASLEDYGMPADKSDQITTIDAATGDAGGMPRDGGAVVITPKAEARPPVQDQGPETASANASAPIPLIVVPPPPPAPAPSIPVSN